MSDNFVVFVLFVKMKKKTTESLLKCLLKCLAVLYNDTISHFNIYLACIRPFVIPNARNTQTTEA